MTPKLLKAIAFEKTTAVIESCQTYQHIIAACNMVDRYSELYALHEGDSSVEVLTTKLEMKSVTLEV